MTNALNNSRNSFALALLCASLVRCQDANIRPGLAGDGGQHQLSGPSQGGQAVSYGWDCAGTVGPVKVELTREEGASALRVRPYVAVGQQRMYFDNSRSGPAFPARYPARIWSLDVELGEFDASMLKDFSFRDWKCPSLSFQDVSTLHPDLMMTDGSRPRMVWRWVADNKSGSPPHYRLVGHQDTSVLAPQEPAPPAKSAKKLKREPAKRQPLNAERIVPRVAPLPPPPWNPVVFEAGGIEWLIPGTACLDHNTATERVPRGYEFAADVDLLSVSRYLYSSAGAGIRNEVSFLLQPEAVVWSSRRKSIVDQWYVVRMSGGNVAPQVPDLCAYVVVKKSPGH